jgi:hypothetical protein
MNEIKLKDKSNKVYYTKFKAERFPHIRIGMVVRILSCSVDWFSW